MLTHPMSSILQQTSIRACIRKDGSCVVSEYAVQAKYTAVLDEIRRGPLFVLIHHISFNTISKPRSEHVSEKRQVWQVWQGPLQHLARHEGKALFFTCPSYLSQYCSKPQSEHVLGKIQVWQVWHGLPQDWMKYNGKALFLPIHISLLILQ